ncbi:EamA-like transporter family-domain-containing protein [Lyophyllum atratum]|nr:EamA-like transporter family-domain-containing protein [Lyophyllum atratum]
MSSRSLYSPLPSHGTDVPPDVVESPLGTPARSREPSPLELPDGEVQLQQRGRWHAKYLAVKGIAKNNVGLLLVTAAQAFLALMNAIVKKLNTIDPPVPTLEMIVVRMTITYICAMTYMICAKVPDPWLGPKGVRLLLVLRGIFGFIGSIGVYASLKYLSLSEATVLTFLAPLCTGIFGAIFLKEKYTKRQALASVVSLLGVILIARPASLFGNTRPGPRFANPIPAQPLLIGILEGRKQEKRLIGVGLALIGVLGSAGAYTTIAAMGRRINPLHAMASHSFQSTIYAAIAMIVRRTPIVVPNEPEWLTLLIMIGLFGFIAQGLLTMGLQRETAGRGPIAIYTQVVFAAIFQWIFFGTTPPFESVIGALIIITAAIYVAVTKNKENKKMDMQKQQSEHDRALEEGLSEGSPPGRAEAPRVEVGADHVNGAHEVSASPQIRRRTSQEYATEATALLAPEGRGTSRSTI